MSVTPSDTLIGPLQDQLCQVAQQISGIDPNLCYGSTPPANNLEDGSVIFPLKSFAVDSATSGKLRIKLTFTALHLFRKRPLDEVIPVIQSYIPAWWTVLADWKNNTLGGLAITFSFTQGEVGTIKHNNTDFYALKHTLEVLVNFNVVTAPN